jgi:hypothetical protein
LASTAEVVLVAQIRLPAHSPSPSKETQDSPSCFGGDSEGDSDGNWDGVSDDGDGEGTIDGNSDGDALGTGLDTGLGELLGEWLGLKLGSKDGMPVGTIEGATLGTLDGTDDGDGEGTIDGNSEGQPKDAGGSEETLQVTDRIKFDALVRAPTPGNSGCAHPNPLMRQKRQVELIEKHE